MRFLVTNLCSEPQTDITSSSANVNFPASNLKDPLRSKRWRSSGSFEITSLNNKINFKESAMGSELTATLADGVYSVAELKAEIKARLETAGSDNYTVNFSNLTGIWSISSDGSYLDILNSSGTDAAESLLVVSLGFPATDKSGATSYSGSLIAIHTSEHVKFDMQTSQDITSVVILWPREDGIRLSPDAEIRVQANATDVWDAPAVNQVLTVDDNYMVASHFFSTPQSLRYWRIVVRDPRNADLYIELGMVWIGENAQFNEPENGFTFGLDDTSKVSRTEFGHEYVDEYPTISTLDFNYAFVEYQTAQALENAFRQNGIRKPVLVVFDEQELVFDRNHFLIYGKMSKAFSLKHVNYNLFRGDLRITELG